MNKIEIFASNRDYDDWIDDCDTDKETPTIILENNREEKSIMFNLLFISAKEPLQALNEFLNVFGDFADISNIANEIKLSVQQGYVCYNAEKYRYIIGFIDNGTLGVEITVMK